MSQYKDKQKHTDIFGQFGLSTTSLVIGKLIETSGEESIILESFSSEDLHVFLTTMRYKMKGYLTRFLKQERSYKYSYIGGYLFSLIFLLACSNEEEPLLENCEIPRTADAYIYPVVPGMPEWADLSTGEEKFEACQIPSDRLKSMSTAGLVESWHEYPLTIGLILAHDYQSGIAFYVKNFSGLQELSNRNDAGTELMSRYQYMKPTCVATYDGDKEGAFTLGFIPVELLLAQDVILDKLSGSQKKALMAEALLKYRQKMWYYDAFGTLAGTGLSLFICVRILKNAEYQPFIEELENEPNLIINQLFDTGILYANPEAPEIQKILDHSQNFINQK